MDRLRMPVWLVAALLFVAPGGEVPAQRAVRASASAARVTGTVVDSMDDRALAAAVVQLVVRDTDVPFAMSATTDSLGRFSFDSVPAGRYTIGFFHPKLDSLGLAAPLREVVVAAGARIAILLAVPGPSSVRGAICGRKGASDSGAVLLGIVRRADTRIPVDRVTVIAQWLELTLGTSGWMRRVARRQTVSEASGWYAMCDLPRGGWIMLQAARDDDSTAMLELEVSGSAVRRDMYINASAVQRRGDSSASLGVARIEGVIIHGATGQRLADAYVGIAGGPATRSNAAGSWTLAGIPAGSRMLEVRAVGFYPVRRVVDVVNDAPPLRIVLSRFSAVLDTVRVTAARFADPRRTGFFERRRSATGRFVTAVDIARRRPRSVSDVLRGIPGIKLERFGTYVDTAAVDTTGTGTNPIGFTADATRILMRASVKDWCFPTFFIDGHQVNTLSAEEVDMWVRPDEISGVEVYGAETVPPQFAMPLANCGSILIWRK